MTPNAFIGQTKPPTDAELSAALGEAKALWDKLLGELAGKLKLTVQEWNSYSPKAGWSLRLKRKDRNIVYLAPRKSCFLASFALGDKAVAAARESGLPPAVIKTINEARRYAEGTAVRLEIKSARDIAVLIHLAGLKLAN